MRNIKLIKKTILMLILSILLTGASFNVVYAEEVEYVNPVTTQTVPPPETTTTTTTTTTPAQTTTTTTTPPDPTTTTVQTGTATPEDSKTTTTTTTTTVNPGAVPPADPEPLPKMPNPIQSPDDYDPRERITEQPMASGLIGRALKMLRNAGVIFAIVALTIIGIKYMLAGGAEEKAQYKETLIPLIIGVVMLVGSLILVTSIADVMQ